MTKARTVRWLRTDAAIMGALRSHDPISVGDLAVHLRRDYMTVFSHLHELVANGFVTRARDPQQRHGYLYGVSERDARRSPKRPKGATAHAAGRSKGDSDSAVHQPSNTRSGAGGAKRRPEPAAKAPEPARFRTGVVRKAGVQAAVRDKRTAVGPTRGRWNRAFSFTGSSIGRQWSDERRLTRSQSDT